MLHTNERNRQSRIGRRGLGRGGGSLSLFSGKGGYLILILRKCGLTYPPPLNKGFGKKLENQNNLKNHFWIFI